MPAVVASHALSRVRALEIKALWSRTFRHSPAFLLTVFFVFLEYVRPIAAYGLGDIPLSQFTLLAAVVACVMEGKSSFNITGAWALIGLFTLVLLASSAQAVYPSVSFAGLEVWISWLLVMFIISSTADTEERLLLMLVGFLLWNLKMSQHSVRSWATAGFGFRDWGVAGAAGWFSNSGEFAIEMCVFLPMVIYFLVGLRPFLSKTRQLFLAGVAFSALLGIVGSSSRGGLLGAAAIGVWIVLLSPHRVAGGFGSALLAGIVWLILPAEQKARFDSAGTDGTSLNRLTYWTDGVKIANDYPLLGIGYDNWMPYYTTHYRANGALPHNIFIEAWAEMGYLGLIAFLLLIGYTFWRNWTTRRATRKEGPNPNRFVYYMAYGLDGALIGYMVSGFFVTVLFYPYFWVNLAFVIALAKVANKREAAPSRPPHGVSASRRSRGGMWRRQAPRGAVAPTAAIRHQPPNPGRG